MLRFSVIFITFGLLLAACESSPPRDPGLPGSGGPGPGTGRGPDAGTPGMGGDGGTGMGTMDAGGPMMGMSCADGRVFCSGECVNTSDDPRHCGHCDTACQPGQVCTSSRTVAPHCMVVQNCPANPCTGFSYCDIGSSKCLAGCVHNDQCGQSETCDLTTHDCVCQAGYHRCSGLCVPDSALTSCGMRCDACPTDPNGTPSCGMSGMCMLTCTSGYHVCGGHCASNHDVMSCGTTSCTPCPTDPNGQASCDSGGSCRLTCNTGFHECSGRCVSNMDPMNCGMRCSACPNDPNGGTATCDGTMCGVTCPMGYMSCTGRCAQCPAGGSSYGCLGAECVISTCSMGQMFCDGSCPQCPTGPGIMGTACAGTSCTISSCSTGYMLCTAPGGSTCAQCPSGQGVGSVGCGSNGTCVAQSCAMGYRLVNGNCVTWTYDQVDTNILDRQVRIAIDPQGNPHIAYLQLFTDGVPHVRHAFKQNGTWTVEDVASILGPDSSDSVAIAIDPSGVPAIAYYDTMNSYLMFAQRSGTSPPWTTQQCDTLGTSASFSIDLKLDKNTGRPRIAYIKPTAGSNSTAYFAWNDGMGWGSVVAGGLGGATVGGISLALDATGNPHVAYSDTINVEHGSAVAGGMFTVETLSQSNSVFDVSLAIDSMGTLRAAFPIQNFGLEYLSKPTGGGWTSGAMIDTGNVGVPTSLKLDSHDVPHVAYYDITNRVLKYGVLNGTSWSVINLDPGMADRGRDASLALDATDQPHIAYIEQTGTNTLKYAH